MMIRRYNHCCKEVDDNITSVLLHNSIFMHKLLLLKSIQVNIIQQSGIY